MALVTTHCQGAAQGATRAVEDPGGGFAFAAAASIMSFGTSVSYWWEKLPGMVCCHQGVNELEELLL